MTFTKEQLIEHAKRRLNYSRCGCRVSDSDRALDEALMETALVALESRADAEPVAWMVRDIDTGEKFIRPDRSYFEGSCQPLYTRPQPAPVAVPDEMEMDDDFDSAFEHGKAVGWNACRAAMLTAAPAAQPEQEPVGIIRYVDIGLPDKKGIHATFYTPLPEGTELFSRPAQEEQTKRLIGWRAADYTEETSDPEMAKNWAAVVGVLPVFEGDINTRLQAEQLSGNTEQVSQPTLPADYLQGHKDGCEWAARMAEANHPQTGDWLYDDPIELSKAIRKGPDMLPAEPGNSPVIPDGWIPVSERMPDDTHWCVVITEYGYYVQCWSEGQGWLGDDISIPNCDVTHWMPLPAAPKQEAE